MKSLAEEYKAVPVDAPFLPGVRVLLKEVTPVAYDDNPRRMFKIWQNEVKSAVMWIQYPLREMLFCSDHDNECTCKQIARAWMET